MSTDVWAQIEIGGMLRRADLQRFLSVFGVGSESALRMFIINDRLVLDRCFCSAPGRFKRLESLCRELGLPYERRSDGAGDIPPELVLWRPGMDEPVSCETASLDSARPVVDMEDMRRVRDLLRRGNDRNALAALETIVIDVPDLPAFEIEAARASTQEAAS